MTVAELIALLPCHSLEDFPLYHDGDEASQLLTAWTALWHPALVAACGKMPRWYRADFPPDDAAGRVYLIPSLSDRLIAVGWKDRVAGQGALVVQASPDCAATVGELLAQAGIDSTVDDDLAADFLAFGYCYLQIELLTRQMRYMSSLDEPHIENQLVLAARAAATGNADTAREHLRKCFDVLMEARDRFYPVDSFLLDIVLTADAFLGQPLRDELATNTPISVYLTGTMLAHLANNDPATLQQLRDRCVADVACVVGGDYNDPDLPLLPLDSIEHELHRAGQVYEELLGRRVRVYMRRRFGLTPLLPLVLSRAGYIGCVHCTFDDGTFPPIGQSKTRWQSLDGSAVDAFGRIPLDARRPETFLGLSQKLAESMDLDHVAAVAFVHWPGETSYWYSLVKRIHRYAHVLGKFVTLDHFFDQSESTGRLDKYDPDDYRSPYLRQAVQREQPDPISCHVRAAQAQVAARSARLFRSFATLVSGQIDESDTPPSAALTQAVTGAPAGGSGAIHFNPFGHDVQLVEESIAAPVVPALGFFWRDPQALPPPPSPERKKAPQPVAAENTLTNEFMEVTVDPATGAIRSLRDFRNRGNRLSQQLALRMPGTRVEVGRPWRDPDESANYSIMVADSVEVVSSGPPVGELLISGRLVDREGTTQANFQQRMQLARGSRLLLIDIHLEPHIELPADPWAAYYTCRFAWSDESADLYRSLHGTAQPSKIKRLEAPRFLEIREDHKRTAILTGGLPFHRRVGSRMLDTLLIVHRESCRDFRLAIGLDLPDTASRAEQLLLPQLPTATSTPPPMEQSGWFFHLDGSNIVPLDWTPLVEEGTVRGFRAKLLETAGRPGRVKLRTFKPVRQATQVDALHNPIVTLSASGDTILVDFSVFELVEIEARWADA